MRNAVFSSPFSSQFCNFGNNNDVPMLNSDVSQLSVYGSSFFHETQLSNDQHLGSFEPLSTIEIPPSLNYLHLPGLLPTSSTTSTGSTSATMNDHNTSQLQFNFTQSVQTTQNERKRSIRIEHSPMDSNYSIVEESKKKKAAIGVEDYRSPNYQHFRERSIFEQTHAPKVPVKRSQKIGDKITALQKLVSPFGKTDTASVLKEASAHIKLLQEQIQMLSTPYFRVGPTPLHLHPPGAGESDDDLRSRGLCLVPVSFTQKIIKEDRTDHSLAMRTSMIPRFGYKYLNTTSPPVFNNNNNNNNNGASII